MNLQEFKNPSFSRGAPRWIEGLWFFLGSPCISSLLPGSYWRVVILRSFGARIGRGVVVKPHVKVKFPWRLNIGDYCWLGEGVWVDNLANVELGDNVCISQGAYLCTGSHDWSAPAFDLITLPIKISNHAWVGAFAKVAPGTVLDDGAVLTMGSVGSGLLASWTINRGNPAMPVKDRLVSE